jgi:protein-S-isoprenylcysteine O-methyltransferase Ste14
MNVDSAHKNVWAIGEVVFGIPFLIGIALQFVFPFSFLQGIARQILALVGIALMVTGIGLIVMARREFNQYGQPTDPGHPTSKIVKTGIFSISRNPLYLGCVISLFGIALAINIFWILVALLVSVIVCHYVLIIPEEKYLAAKFGKEYGEYTNTVRRWFGRISRK